MSNHQACFGPVSFRIAFNFNARFVLLLSCLAFFSCKTTKKVVEIPSVQVKLKGADVIQVFDSMVVNQFEFSYLAAKATVDYTDKTGETQSFDVNMRMRYDSAIWISITPLLGIEVARVIINHDSLMIMDRVHKTFMARDYAYLEEMLKTTVTFEMIQAVVVGNYFTYQRADKIRSVYEDEPYFILSTLNKRRVKRVLEEKDPSKPVIQDFWIDGNFRIAKSKITDERLDRWVEASYKNFTDVGGKLFPNDLVVTISAATPTIIKIAYNKLTPDESFTMPFTVPEKYERK
ncbi:MAG: DUF4292 domain-containing protein [Bacteroidetes bacterium]|nr:MAG: DUF4292 domain-containing protein [Bacteroidota bacterium]